MQQFLLPLKNYFSVRIAAFVMIAMVFANAVAAQTYTRSSFVQAYTPIAGTPITGGALTTNFSTTAGGTSTDEGAALIPLPFNFTYNGTAYTALTNYVNVCTNGFISFVTTNANASKVISSVNADLYSGATPNITIAGWWDDLDANTGTVQYLTTGVAGSQVMTIQYSLRSYKTVSTSTINFQIKLYEGTNVIELLYGSAANALHSTASESASLGIEYGTGGIGNFIDAITGSSRLGNYSVNSEEFPTINYRFTPGAPTAKPGGTYNVGAGQTYPSLTEAIADLNHRGVSGAITLNCTDATYNTTGSSGSNNTFPLAFGVISGVTAANTITVQGNGATISSRGVFAGNVITEGSAVGMTAANQPIVALAGSDYVTFKNFTLGYASVLTNKPSRGVYITNATVSDGATNNTIQDVSITLERSNPNSIGIYQNIFPVTLTSSSGANSNNKYYNVTVKNSFSGIHLKASTTNSFPDVGCEIGTTGGGSTTIGDAVPNDIGGTAQTWGIRATYQKNVKIFNCTVRNVTGTSTFKVDGIFLDDSASAVDMGTCEIYNNIVQTLNNSNTSAGVVTGIRANLPSMANNTARIYNNFVFGLSSNSGNISTRQIIGIKVQDFGLSGVLSIYYVDFNSVSITSSSTSPSSCFEFGEKTNIGNIFVRDNVFSNTATNGTHYCVVTPTSSLGGSSGVWNNNVYYVTGGTGFTGSYNSFDELALANWQAASGQDASTRGEDPKFVSATSDLHIQTGVATPVESNGSYFSGTYANTWTTTDIDAQTRNVTTPDIGADEGNFTPYIYKDIQAAAFVVPLDLASIASGSTVTPQASFTNNGAYTQTSVQVKYRILDPVNVVFYDQPATIASLAQSATTTVTFPVSGMFTTTGTYKIQAIALLTGDQVTSNDTLNGTITVTDGTPPVITYTILNPSCTPVQTLSNVIITDAGSGVNTTIGTKPRLYYKRASNADTYAGNTSADNGWKYVEATNSSSPFTFTIDASILFGATTGGEQIQYFVVAQDLATPPNVAINSGTFTATPSSVALTSAAFPVGVTNSFTITGLAGTYNIPGNYATLSAAVSAYNGSCIAGPIVFQLAAGYSSGGETFPITINSNIYQSATNTLTIKPASSVTATISGSSATSIFKLNGADYVTIDGSNSGGTSKDLTITNTNTGTSSAVVWVASASASDGATKNTIKNTIISGNSSTTTLMGVFSGGTSTIGISGNALTQNSNDTFQNNQISKAQYGIFLLGTATSTLDASNSINSNALGTAVSGDGFSISGIVVQNQSGVSISQNSIQNLKNTGGTFLRDLAGVSDVISGIYLRNCKTASVSKNKVFNINISATGLQRLLCISAESPAFNTSGNQSANVFSNNMIYDCRGSGSGVAIWGVSGINCNGGYGDKFYFNSIYLSGSLVASSGAPSAIFSNGNGSTSVTTSKITLKNNAFYMAGTISGNLYVHYTTLGSYSGSSLTFNDLYINVSFPATGYIGYFASTNQTTLSDWQSATSQDLGSLNGDPQFTSTTDLHIASTTSIVGDAGTPITGITTDIDGDSRSATTPDIGADEFATASCAGAVAGSASNLSGLLCNSGDADIVSTGYSVGSGTDYQWQSSPDNSTWTDISGANTPSYYNTGTISTTTYYRLKVTCSLGSPVYSNSVTVTVNTVTLNSATGGTRCGPGSVTLSASASGSPTYNWYNAASGGDLLQSSTTATFTTPAITTTTDYWVTAGGASSLVGLSSNTTGCGSIVSNTLTDKPLRITTTGPAIIKSAYVIPGTSGTLTVVLRNSPTTTTLQTANFTITAAQIGTPVQITLNFSIGGSGNYQLTSTQGGLYRISSYTCGYPFTSAGGTFKIVGSANSSTVGTNTTSYNSFYDIDISEGCESPRTQVTATVTASPAITATATPSTVCGGRNVALNVTSLNPYTYTWVPGNLSGASQTVTPASSVVYTVNAIDNSGGANNSCTATANVAVTVSATPSTVTVSPSSVSFCSGSSAQLLTASGGTVSGITIFTEDFNDVTNLWTKINNSFGGTDPSLAAWTLQTSPYTYTRRGTVFQSNDNSQFYISNSDDQFFGGTTLTELISPTFSLVGYTSASLNFYQYFLALSDHAYVEITTNGGSTWNTLVDQTSTKGGRTSFLLTTLDITPYIGNASVQIRFRYSSSFGWYWAIDNVKITGTQSSTMTWAPIAGLYTDAGATTPYMAGANTTTVYAKPAITTTYMSTATAGSTSCTSSATSTFTVVSTGTWLGNSVDWNNAGNWCGGIPGPGTNVIIPTGVSFYPTFSSAPAISANTVTINSGALLTIPNGVTLTLTSGLTNNGTFTMSGTANVNINSGGSFTNAGTFTTTTSTGAVTFSGTGTVSGTAVPFRNVNISGGVDFGTTSSILGTLTINSGGFVNNCKPPSYASGSLLKYNTGGTYGRNCEWSALSGVGYPYNVQISNNTTLNYPNGSPTVARSIVGDLTIDAGSSLYMDYGSPGTNAPLTVPGNITVNGNLSLGDASGGDLKLAGNWTSAAASVFNFHNRAVNFNNATTLQTITGGATVPFDMILINNGSAGGVKLSTGTNISVSNSVAGNALQLLAAGPLDLNGQTCTLGLGTFGSIQINGTRNIISSIGTGIFVLNGAVTPPSVNGSGSLITSSAVRVELNKGFNFGGSLTTINGILRMNQNSFVTSAPIYGNSSLLQYYATGNYNRTVEWGTISGPGYPYNVQVSNSTTLVPGGSSNTATPLNTAGNLTIDAGSNFYMDFSSFDMTIPLIVNGDITINGGLSESDIGGGDVQLKGNWLNNGTFTPKNRTVTFNGTLAQSIGGSNNTVFDYFTNSNAAATVTMNKNVTVNQTGTLNAGSTLALGANTLALNGTITGTGLLAGSISSNLSIGGTTSSVGTLNFLAGSQNLNNFTLNRTGIGQNPAALLGSALSIKSLTLTNGILSTNHKLLTYDRTGTYTPPALYTNSYICTCDGAVVTDATDGSQGFKIQNIGRTNTDVFFPVSSDYKSPNRMMINNQNGTANDFTVVVGKGDIGNTPNPVVERIWYVKASGSGAKATMQLFFTKRDVTGYPFLEDEVESPFNYGDIHLAQQNASNVFVNISSASDTKNFIASANGTEIYGLYTYGVSPDNVGGLQGINTFNRFAVINSADYILPVNIIGFKAWQQGTAVQLAWTALNEIDIDHYEVERSADARGFTVLGNVAAKNTGSSADYSFADQKPNTGNNYYRIKVYDKNGAIYYTQIINVIINANGGAAITIYPNPVSNGRFTLQMTNMSAAKYNLLIYDEKGRLVFSRTIEHTGGSASQSIELPAGTAAGVYEVNLMGKDYNFRQKLVITGN